MVRALQQLSMHMVAISCWTNLKYISKPNGMYNRNYLLMIDIEEKIRSCVENLANDIEVYTSDVDHCLTWVGGSLSEAAVEMDEPETVTVDACELTADVELTVASTVF